MPEERARGASGLFSAVSAYLDDVEYPCTKAQLLDYAASHGAPEMVLEALQQLPEEQYYNFAHLTDRFSKVNP